MNAGIEVQRDVENPLLYNKPVKIEELLKTKREQILEICQKHGEGTEQSDVDFLVDVGPVHSPWFPVGLLADLEDLLGVPVDVVTRDSLHRYIKIGYWRKRDLYEDRKTQDAVLRNLNTLAE